jgi:DNA-binding Lrp family transcriptional regulator
MARKGVRQMEYIYSSYRGYRPGDGGDEALAGELEGDWGTYAKIAEYFVRKVKLEDREDFRHDLILEMAKVKAKYEVKGKPLTEAGMMRVCSYELTAYWEKERMRARGIIVDCGNCGKEQRQRCRDESPNLRCRKAKRFVSLNQAIGDDGLELWEVLADDNALDLDAWVDARALLRRFPRKLTMIGYKEIAGIPLSGEDKAYLKLWRENGRQEKPKRIPARNWYDLEETILSLLRDNGGMSRRDLYTRLNLSPRELGWYCDPLVRQGLIREMKRENGHGRPLTPLLIAAQPGEPLPEPKPDKMERIRQAYSEGKGIKQIAREFHHATRTVRKAIRMEAEKRAQVEAKAKEPVAVA